MRLRLIVPLLASIVVVGACGSLTAPAATVNGVDISEEELRDELEAAAEFSALNPGVVQGLDPVGVNYQRSSARGLLNERVTSEIFADALDDLGGEVTEEERTRTGEAFAQLQSNEWLEIQFERQVTQQALVRVLTEQAGLPPDAEAWYEENGESLGLVCASHILLATEEEAAAARARVVDDGEDFAAVAMEVSVGPTGPNGGDLGCSDPSRFVVEFADALRVAEIGVVTEPVQSEFGWHVINVRARGTDVSFADAAQLAEESFEAERSAVIGASVNGLLAEADVHVASRYGVWDGTQIVPE